MDRLRAGITGWFQVTGEKDNGRSVIEFCVERRLSVSSTYFEHKSLHKYTKGDGSQDRMEMINMIELVLVKKEMLCYEQDVRVVRGMGRSVTDDHVVLCKFRLVGALI